MDGLRVGAAGSAAVEGIQFFRAVPCGHLSQPLCNVPNKFEVLVIYVASEIFISLHGC